MSEYERVSMRESIEESNKRDLIERVIYESMLERVDERVCGTVPRECMCATP